MLDPEARALLDLMEQAVQAGRPKLETLSYKEGRLAVDKMSEDSEAEPLAVGEVDDGGFAGPAGEIRFRHYVPLVSGDGPLPTLVYYHGGGFVIGNLETHDSTCRRLANKSRCQVIAIDYRLSPEHPFPAPIEDGVAAFRHIRDNAAQFGVELRQSRHRPSCHAPCWARSRSSSRPSRRWPARSSMNRVTASTE